jgi:CubicO group peptidase (beta-lactamase class C family)
VEGACQSWLAATCERPPTAVAHRGPDSARLSRLPLDQPAPSLVEVLQGSGNTPPVRVGTIPGLQFSYSGGGYCVLQQLLVDLTGLAFPELAQELVLGPLGMGDSSYQQPLPEHRWAQAARGHRIGGAPVAGGWHVYPEMAAGGLWTTPSDLARFAAAVQRARAGAPGAILPPGLAGELLRPQAPNRRMGWVWSLRAKDPRCVSGMTATTRDLLRGCWPPRLPAREWWRW